MRRVSSALIAFAVLIAPRISDACVQHPEMNTVLGWAADGSAALHALVEDGKVVLAEIHPTRYEGWKYFIGEEGGAIHVKKVSVARCEAFRSAKTRSRFAGPLTEHTLRALPIVEAMQLVAPPADDGGAARLTAAFVPKKRYAEHQVEIRDGDQVVETLTVPVWCTGSCHRDEAHAEWTAEVRQVAVVGDRTLYVIRMRGVCNDANGKDLWMDRVIAVPGPERRPKRDRCRGSH
jgi:hypothetical protein